MSATTAGDRGNDRLAEHQDHNRGQRRHAGADPKARVAAFLRRAAPT